MQVRIFIEPKIFSLERNQPAKNILLMAIYFVLQEALISA
jgi:hypothetical protein